MQPIKMIVTDLDATLLNDEKNISNYTLETIKKARAKGVKFVPATARALRVLTRLNVTTLFPYDALITFNGSKTFINNQLVYEQGMSKDELDQVLPLLLKHYGDRRITIEMNETAYANHNIWEVDSHEKNYVITDFSDLPNILTTRIILDLPSIEDLPTIQSLLPNYMYAHCIEGTNLCRVLHKSVTKAKAIEYLCQLWNVLPSEIACFGDDSNDIQMFDFCGISVAVENAIEEVKEAATDHTTSNNDDGVAKWIYKNIL